MAIDFTTPGAAELASRLETGELSPVAILSDCLDRIDRANPELNALTVVDREGALRAAQASEARQRSGRRLGPLDGLPLSIKDNLFVRNLPATWGSKLYEHHVPEHDDLWVTRLREAGAVIVGKSNTPEFALGSVTENPVFGVTRNPWAPDLVPGGSSGGAAVSVASGMLPLGIGTDAGGSIRLPASFTGVVGLKPSVGRIPRLHGFPSIIADFQVIGLIGRKVADVDMCLKVIAGGDARDRASLAFGGEVEPRLDAVRIGVVEEVAGVPVEPEVLAALRDAADRAAQHGLELTRRSAPFNLDEMMRFWPTLSSVGIARILEKFCASDQARVTDTIAGLARRGSSISGAQYAQALDQLNAFRASVAAAFEPHNLLLTPTSPTLPWPVGEGPPTAIAGREANARTPLAFNTFVNAAGYPAISIPWRLSRAGLPIGIQLVAKFGQEALLLAMGRRFESFSPWSTAAERQAS